MTTEQRTIQDFITEHAITMTAERVPANPNMSEDPSWAHTAAHHLCTFSMDGRTLDTYFSQGAAAFDHARAPFHHKMKPVHFGDSPRCDGCFKAWPCEDVLKSKAESAQPTTPDLATVLDCLISDATGHDNARDFADWCGEYGYDEDSRKAKRTFDSIAEQARKLRQFLGDTYNDLADCERL